MGVPGARRTGGLPQRWHFPHFSVRITGLPERLCSVGSSKQEPMNTRILGPMIDRHGVRSPSAIGSPAAGRRRLRKRRSGF